jgi:hypothetical protein
MTDIIARLRHECELLRPESNWRQLTEEAALEIEKLRAEVEGLRATELQRESRQSSGGLSPDDGFGGGKSVFNSSWYGTGR